MSASDYYRPSSSQIHHHYRCQKCRLDVTIESHYAAPLSCHCGGSYSLIGESYPADPNEWDEQRDPDGEWRPRRW